MISGPAVHRRVGAGRPQSARARSAAAVRDDADAAAAGSIGACRPGTGRTAAAAAGDFGASRPRTDRDHVCDRR